MVLSQIQHGPLISSYEIILSCIILLYIVSLIFLRGSWNKIKYPHFWLLFVLFIPVFGSLIFLVFLGKIRSTNGLGVLVFLIGTGALFTSCQDKNTETKAYDYFSHDYKYLDDDLNIKISSDEFQRILTKYKGKSDRIKTRNDSLTILMREDFSDNSEAIIAYNQLKFSFLRVSYYLWLTEEEVKDLAKRYNCKYPYHLYDLIYNKQDDWDFNIKHLISNLRKRVLEETKNEDISKMDHKTFLKYALKESPQRKFDYHQLLMSGEIKCQSEKCCQDNPSDSILNN